METPQPPEQSSEPTPASSPEMGQAKPEQMQQPINIIEMLDTGERVAHLVLERDDVLTFATIEKLLNQTDSPAAKAAILTQFLVKYVDPRYAGETAIDNREPSLRESILRELDKLINPTEGVDY